MTTELPTPRQLRQGIAEKLAGLPGVDHNARSDQDRAADAARIERVAQADAPTPEPPAQAGMKPNPLQGHSSAAPANPAPVSSLDAIRLQARKNLL